MIKTEFYRKLSIAVIIILVAVSFSTALNANPFIGSESGTTRPAPPPVYSSGPNVLMMLQFEFRDKIADELGMIREGVRGNTLFLFLGLCFLYGLFHAAGPGHRKTIVFSLFLSKKVKWFEPAAAGLLSAALHGGSSILIIGVLFSIQKAVLSISSAENVYAYTEGITFIFLAVFSAGFIVYKIYSTVRGKMPSHEDDKNRSIYPLIIVTSIVPCPGATMLLLLALYTGVIGAGVLGIVSMSLGMSVVIALSGYIAYAGREGLFLFFKKKENLLLGISTVLEIVSFLIILLFSTVMVIPFLRSIICVL